MNAIVVVDENWNIGKDGKLLVHLPGDLGYFKEKTTNKTVVIGRKTLDSFPGGKPLPGRENIVLTRNTACDYPGCIVCHSKEELEDHIEGKETYIAGGAEIYRQFLGECDTFYVTKIFAAFQADSSFPNLDEMADLEIVWKSDIKQENNTKYQFYKYIRK